MGLVSVGVAALVWLSMGVVSYRVVIGYPSHVHSAKDIMWGALWVQWSAMILFGFFVTWGIIERKNAAMHKRLLYLAMIVLLQSAVGRISWLPWLAAYPNAFFIYLDLVLIPLVVFDIMISKTVHKITSIGGIFIMAVQLIAMMF